jgi:hypothetical protein
MFRTENPRVGFTVRIWSRWWPNAWDVCTATLVHFLQRWHYLKLLSSGQNRLVTARDSALLTQMLQKCKGNSRYPGWHSLECRKVGSRTLERVEDPTAEGSEICSRLQGRGRWNVMAHAQKPDFVFRRNARVHLNRRGRQFSRILAAEVCASAFIVGSNAGYTMFRGSGYPLHSLVSPSLPLPCFTVCHHISTGVYLI